jgi:hypothetical protein
MSNPPIVLGDLRSILALPLAPMRDPSDWSQANSDTVAHFLQVERQIRRSRWMQSQVSYRVEGERAVDACLPEFEDFVFAAVYFRQFTLTDSPLNHATDIFVRVANCPVTRAWVEAERSRFRDQLCGPVRLINDSASLLSAVSVRQLFDAFLYGAYLIHAPGFVRDGNDARFLQIYDNEPRHELLFALHASLQLLMIHVGNVAHVVHRHFAHWLNEHSLPRPNVRWHDRLFNVNLPT